MESGVDLRSWRHSFFVPFLLKIVDGRENAVVDVYKSAASFPVSISQESSSSLKEETSPLQPKEQEREGPRRLWTVFPLHPTPGCTSQELLLLLADDTLHSR